MGLQLLLKFLGLFDHFRAQAPDLPTEHPQLSQTAAAQHHPEYIKKVGEVHASAPKSPRPRGP